MGVSGYNCLYVSLNNVLLRCSLVDKQLCILKNLRDTNLLYLNLVLYFFLSSIHCLLVSINTLLMTQQWHRYSNAFSLDKAAVIIFSVATTIAEHAYVMSANPSLSCLEKQVDILILIYLKTRCCMCYSAGVMIQQ